MNKLIKISEGTYINPERIDAISYDGYIGSTFIYSNGASIPVGCKPYEIFDKLEAAGEVIQVETAVKKAVRKK